MSVDYLEGLLQRNPGEASLLQPVLDAARQKLWHQLTDALQPLVASPFMRQGQNLVQLYTNFLSKIEAKLNPLKVAQFVVAVSRQMEGTDSKPFLQHSLERISSDEGKVVVMSEIAVNHLRDGSPIDCKRQLETAHALLDSIPMADPSVHSAYHRAALEYYKREGPASEYYKSGLAYLSCTPLASISSEDQTKLAFELSLAALLGEDVYNFGDLVQTPVFGTLERGGHKWLADIVQAFNHGDIAAYRELRSTHKAQIQAVSTLQMGEAMLSQKLVILSLMDMIFGRAAADRVLSFAEVAARTQLPIDQVEFCVMKALALGLIRGTIDEVAQTITITWVRPRVLDKDQIASLRARLHDWVGSVHKMVDLLSNETKEMVA